MCTYHFNIENSNHLSKTVVVFPIVYWHLWVSAYWSHLEGNNNACYCFNNYLSFDWNFTAVFFFKNVSDVSDRGNLLNRLN
ncbi:unnamed protein product [Blepharisma stoltei]|uniref:Uncharacterized protein n=1 Tax=Blepharisma stoltei TaxID=1481888 RepID=A0AAU9JE87_9CILI|nr:unnamed protein product [Blepharisma stoltei]